MDPSQIHRLLAVLSDETNALVGGAVERLDKPTAASFARFVATNRPCVLTGVVGAWPASSLWTMEHLAHKLADTKVSVNCTPNGQADAVVQCPEHGAVFVLPEERRMSFLSFLALLRTRDAVCPCVPYLSAQNGSFADFTQLAKDVPAQLQWATEAFGCAPDACNLWMGDSRAVTTFHSDPYENLYAVIAGEKRFTLLPPTDVHRLYNRSCPVGRYSCDGRQWCVELEQPPRHVSWACVDPDSPDAAAYPRYFQGAPPVEVTLRAGEMLYLPALWAHRVAQSDGTVAVNWWHDQRYDGRYAQHQFLTSLSEALDTHSAP